MNLDGSELITRYLEALGVRHVAGAHPPTRGDALLPLHRALRGSGLLQVHARDTQSAGFIAQGIARATDHAGVCLATAGADITGLLTVIADARADAVPLVVICVRAACTGDGRPSEMRVGYLVDPIAKAHLEVRSAEDLGDLLPEAFRIAQSETPGPVVLEMPVDALTTRIEWTPLPAPAADGSVHRQNLPAFGFQTPTYRGAQHATSS